MLMTEIRREVVDLPEDGEFATVLAEEAETVLGYTLMKAAIAKASDVEADERQLSRTLRELDIPVLRKSDVEEYQLAEQKELTEKLFKKWMSTNESVDTWSRFSGPAWTDTKIEEYRQPVPGFVLNKAVQIKKAIPDCEIFIRQLEQHPDPFLIVRTTQEKSYDWGKSRQTVEQFIVEVWAEPKFEARM